MNQKEQWEAARILWEARKRDAWGKAAEVMIERTPWQAHSSHPLVAVEHELAFAEIKALCKHYDITPKTNR